MPLHEEVMPVDRHLDILIRVDERTHNLVESVATLRDEVRENRDENRVWKAAMDARVAATEARLAAIEVSRKEQKAYGKGALAVITTLVSGITMLANLVWNWWISHTASK